jgi:hypothetical protein
MQSSVSFPTKIIPSEHRQFDVSQSRTGRALRMRQQKILRRLKLEYLRKPKFG